ncbi:hypothetical protein DFP72DRAFT_863405 [Ephemerocybe angulata]|uniref:Uncharacterized protein n=1 Tax=Ephemerocybe angulata TaxID=980116 RepID=A0A8H6H6Q1_9AGAR|nr:hypothetical protein DFP72DRAFT_863405 [Tulosesus angulatus]
MNTTNTVHSRSQASVPGQEIRERAPTPAELIARLNQRNQTASLATKIEYDEYSDLFRRAWRNIPSFKSLNEGTKDDTEDEEMQALLNSFNLYCHTETEEMQVLLNSYAANMRYRLDYEVNQMVDNVWKKEDSITGL